MLQRKWKRISNLIQVYNKLTYTPFTRTASLSPSIARLTLTVGSVGKHFYATGWRVGFLIGPEDLIACVRKAHTRVCFISPSVLQETAAVGYEVAEKKGFWGQAIEEIAGKMKRFCEVWGELGLPVSNLGKGRRVNSVARETC
jgi:kynurenine aminotransferase